MSSQSHASPKCFFVYNQELKDFTRVFFRECAADRLPQQLDGASDRSACVAESYRSDEAKSAKAEEALSM